jgi:hypothetical protein
MQTQLTIPHRVKPGMCPVNGIRDMVQWRTGNDWSNEFLWGLGQGAGFAYLRFDKADPPRQVFTGNATPRQHKYLADLFNAPFSDIENRTFTFSWGKAKAAIDAGIPPILGPLDMYHLHYYPELYHKRHIPIHYVLLVGYDNENAFILDTGEPDVQEIPLDDLQQAWDVNVPGMGKRNHVAIMEIPQELLSVEKLIRKAIKDNCQIMLEPPVSMVGIPAMRKLAREIGHWEEELGKDTAEKCLLHAVEYLNSPPDSQGNHLTAGRDLTITFLVEAGDMAGLDFSYAINLLQTSISIIPVLAGSIRKKDLEKAAKLIDQFADVEEQAFLELKKRIQ